MAHPPPSSTLTQLVIDQLISNDHKNNNRKRNDQSDPEAGSLSSYAAVNERMALWD